MFEKLSLALVVLVSLFVFTGCTRPEPQPLPNPPVEQPSTSNETALKDGIYKAEGQPDERGWKGTVEVTVANGKIDKVVYEEVNLEGKLKSQDAGYATRMAEKSKITPTEAYKIIQEDLVAKQDIEKVDTVAGATHSVDLFKELVKKALETAK